MENIQNMQPNCPQLLELIRQNLNYQHQQSIKKTLFKESLIKLSLDKDFQHIFNHDSPIDEPKPLLVEVPAQIGKICSWLQQDGDFKGIAYLPIKILPTLIHILHQKVEQLTIIISQYQQWWLQKMKQLQKLITLNWGFLNCHMDKQNKVKVLELYQLKKLKLLFISPSLLKSQSYHSFQCNLLVICDLHLYQKSFDIFNQITIKTNPNRILAINHTLTEQPYKQLNLYSINSPDTTQYQFISLKTLPSEKSKSILQYINNNKSKINNVLVIGKKAQLAQLHKKLLMQSMKVCNLTDTLTQSQIHSYTIPQILTRTDKKQSKIFELINKSSQQTITLSTYFDALRFGQYDAVIYCSFLGVDKFLDYCPQVKYKLMLLVDQDYYIFRNWITSDYLGFNHLQKIMIKLMQKPKKKQQIGFKRCYSQHITQNIFDCFSTSKQKIIKHTQKVIKINSFCKNYQISSKILLRIIDILIINKIINIIHKTPYQIEIDQQSFQYFKKLHPKIMQIRKKVNILSLSTCLQKTVYEILTELQQKGLKYKIIQQAIQIQLIKDYQQIPWIEIQNYLNSYIENLTNKIDQSYQMFKNYSYISMELTKRQKSLNRTDKLINFRNQLSNYKKINILESCHRSNLLTAQIEQWLRNSQEKIDQHQLVLMLQGVDKHKINHFKTQPIYGRYRRFKYQQLIQAVEKITKHKRIKL